MKTTMNRSATNRPNVFEKAAANLKKLRESAPPPDPEMSAGIKELEQAVAAIEKGSPRVNHSVPVSQAAARLDVSEGTETPMTLDEFVRQMNGIKDARQRSSFYSTHARRLGVDSTKPMIEAGAAGPSTVADFMLAYNQIAEPTEAAQFYNQHAGRLGL